MKELIRKTLERDFDFQQYAELIKNFFNEIQLQPQEIRVPEGSKDFIMKITFLADFCDAEKKNIDVYAVELSGGTKVERARSFQRNLISKLLKDNTKDAGLVAFYSHDNPDWRLSFIKLEYKLTDKGVKVEVGTPPKRYSFLVGAGEPSHTAQKQLLPILEDHKHNPLLSDIQEAFSVEKVTKEFYERYRKLFEALSKDLKKNKAFQIIAEKENIDIDNFAKKLLGQIVFLYFLQKKGWLGVPQDKTWGNGDKFFLRTLFNKAKEEKKDFYDGYLEPLFYDTLNNPRRDEVDPAYSRHFGCKIPFLNGGLFEPDYDWKNTIVYLGDEIFKEIIETFDLYNFTVKEDEPLEKEVAVDPEMLGKVFENLLPENMRKGQGAYYTPREIVHYMCQESLINHLSTETKIEAERVRKLIAFKDEDVINGDVSRKKTLGFSEKEIGLLDHGLTNIKVCDPACGSGAFLVGMLNEIVNARCILEPRSEYKLKKEIIQNCIYGVDIDPGAVDIAKLRLWLSLVVDFELRDIEPLPNLDYKIMCGNSLLEELIVGDESIKLFDERLLISRKSGKENGLFENIDTEAHISKPQELRDLLNYKQRQLLELHSKNKLSKENRKQLEQEIDIINKKLNPKVKKFKFATYYSTLFNEEAERYFKELRELHSQYFTEYDPAKKKEKKKQIENIELEFIKSSIKEKVDELDVKIKNLNMQDPDDRKKQTGLMKKKLEYMAIPGQIHESKTRPYFLWKLNFFEVFQEKGGFDAIIANPPYLKERDNKKVFEIVNNSEFGKKYHQGKMDYWYYFLHKAIDLSKKDGAISYITSRYWLNSSGSRNLIQRIRAEVSFINMIDIGKLKVFDVVSGHHMVAVYQKNNSIDKFVYKKLENDISDIAKCVNTDNVQIKILSNKEIFKNSEIIFEKDNLNLKNVIKLGDIADITQGVVEAPDKLSRKALEKSKRSDLSLGDGVFVLNGKELEKLRLNKKEKTVVKRYLDPSDILKYCMKWDKKYLIYSDKQTRDCIEHDSGFKNLKKHLDKFKEFITSSNKPYGLHRPRDVKYFINPKIIFKNMFMNNQFTFDEGNYFFGFSFSSLIGKDKNYNLKYILALLNSQFALAWFYRNGKKRGAGIDIGVDKLRSFPIKKADGDKQKLFIELVDKIIHITSYDDYLVNETKQAKVKEYERQIDQMVYKLYGLTDDEIKIVEEFHEKEMK